MNPRFLAIAQDPSIIHGVHHHCDEWCDYCALTARCLGFRCTEAFMEERGRRRRHPAFAAFASTEEAAAFTRELCLIDGSRTEELDAILAGDRSRFAIDDTLASTAWEYAVEAAFLFTTETMRLLAEGPRRTATPTDEEVVLWYHLRIYMRVVRALISARGAREDSRLVEDANGSAKLVLVSIERSQAALRSLRSAGGRPELDGLLVALASLRREIEKRFPNARAYIRFGLDCPVA